MKNCHAPTAWFSRPAAGRSRDFNQNATAVGTALADAFVHALAKVARQHLKLTHRAVQIDVRRAKRRQETRAAACCVGDLVQREKVCRNNVVGIQDHAQVAVHGLWLGGVFVSLKFFESSFVCCRTTHFCFANRGKTKNPKKMFEMIETTTHAEDDFVAHGRQQRV